jgi:hypothetical protein
MNGRMLRHVGVICAVGVAGGLSGVAHGARPASDPYASYRNRSSITLSVTARDFTPAGSGGHADFGRIATSGAGRYFNMVGTALGPDGVPAYGTTGFKMSASWRDSSARNIIPAKSYISAWTGDVPGAMAATAGGAISTPGLFSQWFSDVAGVNTRYATSAVLAYSSGSHSYVFDGSLDGFRESGVNDYSYTCAMDTPFIYERGLGSFVSTTTGGDIWVFVDDKLVTDNGAGMGVRPAIAVQDTILIENSAVSGYNNNGASSISTNSTAAGAISVQNSAQILGDALVGPGGSTTTGISTARSDSITGTTGALTSPMPIAIVSDPVGMPASAGNRTIGNHVTTTLSGNLHYNALTIRVGSNVTINGACRILCDGAFTLEQTSTILLAAGARLELYTHGAVFIQNTATINQNTLDPDRVIIAAMGASGINLDNNTNAWAHLVAPNATVDISNSSTLYGSITGRAAHLHNTGRLSAMGLWGTAFGGMSMSASQRIDVDRLAWLQDGRTHELRVFFANRTGLASHLRLEAGLQLLNIASLPSPAAQAD